MVKVYCRSCSNRCVGDVLKVGDNYFHQSCFICKDCSKPLDTGGFFCRNESYYCREDYTKRFSNNCFICQAPIKSEVVSALNHHFHKDCFKCSTCKKTFVPGDRVIMKNNVFMCETCNVSKSPETAADVLSTNDSGYNSSSLVPPQTSSSCQLNQKKILLSPDSHTKEPSSDDPATDQGYISADPTSVSSPVQQELTSPLEVLQAAQPLQPTKPSRSAQPVSQLKKSQRNSRSLFEFGKFYNSSYLQIQENQRNQTRNFRHQKQQAHSLLPHRSSQTTVSTTTISTAPVPNRYSSDYHLPLSKPGQRQQQRQRWCTVGMRGLLSAPFTAAAAGIRLRAGEEPVSEEEVGADGEVGKGKQNVVRMAAYPAGQRHPEDEPMPLDRDDWPAPLYSAVIRAHKGPQKQSQRQSDVTNGDTECLDCTQSLDQISPTTHKSHNRRIQDLLDILYGPQNSTGSESVRTLNDAVISTSRSPNARVEPTAKMRYLNHNDKSNSRNSSYVKDVSRYKGYSMDYISSTNRPFLAGTIDNRSTRGQLTTYEASLNCLLQQRISLGNHNHRGRMGGHRESGTLVSTPTPMMVAGGGLDHNNNHQQYHHHHQQVQHPHTDGEESSSLGLYDTGLSWTATRTMSDNFDVHLKATSEYDSTLEETLFETQEDEEHDEAVKAAASRARTGVSSSLCEVNQLTGLRHIHTTRHQPRVAMVSAAVPPQPTTAAATGTLSGRSSSVTSRLDSLDENGSLWSYKPTATLGRTNIVTYADLRSKESRILKGLDQHKLEIYLSDEEFQLIFGLGRVAFYRLPEWKRNDIKRRVDLF